jgi:hypothetical protein
VVEKSSLGYVIREDIFRPAAIIDSAWDTAGSRYDSINDKMIARMRIIDADLQNPAISIDHYKVNGLFADSYVKDRSRVWDLLVAIFSATEAWTVIKTFKVKRNGRGAWLALWLYYLGPNNHDHMASEAKKSFIRGCHMSHNGAFFNGLPMPLRLDHIQTFYVDSLRTYFSKVCT